MSLNRSPNVDVIILGGGPAGLSLSVLLAQLGRSVIVLERTQYERVRVGETFGGELIPLLKSIGLWDELQAVPRTPFRGIRSAWNDSALIERASIFNPFGEGWHVERVAFDTAIARAVERAGVTIYTGTGTSSVERCNDTWLVRPTLGKPLTGRYLVDASGRGARASAVSRPERQWLQMDRLVAMGALLTPPRASCDSILELEAVEAGWWYSSPQPNGKLLVTLITDADLLPTQANSSLSKVFSTALACTTHTLRRCQGVDLDSSPWIVRADTGTLIPQHGSNWCAIGDAAMACDPLAGNGVVRALQSAIDAAPKIESALTSGAIPNESNAIQQRFLAYLDLRARYYQSENRFSNTPFWTRRHQINWRTAPLFLEPQQLLQWDSIPPPRALISPVESLLPPRAVRLLLRLIQHPVPAHQALTTLRANTFLEDRKLLVAVQLLITQGIVTTK